MKGDRSYHIGPVEVTRHRVDWSNAGPEFHDFADATLSRVMAIPLEFMGHIYLNPVFTVRATSSVPEEVFLRQANRACILWNKQLSRVLGSRARKGAARRSDNQTRMLAFSGFLVIHGKHVHTKKLNRSDSVAK